MLKNNRKIYNPFPTIVHSILFEEVEELNKSLLNFVKELTNSQKDASEGDYFLSTEGASQPAIDIVKKFYGEVDCITKFVDDIMLPSSMEWAKHHFSELTGSEEYGGDFDFTSWATHYTPGSWQTPHIHRDKMFTGVYFVKMPDNKKSLTNGANCTSDVQNQPSNMQSEGAFVIQNPHLQSSQPTIGGWTTAQEFMPKEGELIIIPSWLSHYPKPVSAGARCGIVFDARYNVDAFEVNFNHTPIIRDNEI